MFKKILIANRGEIACRIIKTCKKMGIQTVAVYSTADKDSLHVLQADSAFCIGKATSKESYLNINNIIQAAKESGAEAIHPGYGFLSESSLFAHECADANIVFVGPSLSAIETMASKQLAKQTLEKTQVPLIPGYHGINQEDTTLLKEAKKIGFPILLKAAQGGGGKGMRAVYEEKDFFNELVAARREAEASFADDKMLIEKLLLNPRHIEVQVVADNYGNVLHIFERDCSIQRRHQKVIEEAPAPHLSTNLREKLLDAAITVAQSIQYRGVGTIEFLVKDDHFYFMEMNTRLQVEHPVTEMITNLDLVELQLKIAANEHLTLTQPEIIARGHSIECRIYAEDPNHNFIPSIGKITYLNEPKEEGIRIDTGVAKHSIVSPYYDAMIAKLIAWGENRDDALRRLQQALRNYQIGGIKTNLSFLSAICSNQNFSNGNFGTHFLEQESLDFRGQEDRDTLALLMAASYDYLHITSATSDVISHQCFGWQMHLTSAWEWRYLTTDNDEKRLKIFPLTLNSFKVKYQEQEWILSAKMDQHQLWIDNEKETQHAFLEVEKDNLIIHLQQCPTVIRRYNWQILNDISSKKGQLIAPMPATIVAVLKNEGETIKKGDCLMILEAMKMEHTIYAPHDGLLAELFYKVGEQVNEGAELLTISND